MTKFNAIPAAQSVVTSLHRVLVIDAQVDDYQQLVTGVQPGVAVHVLEPHRDGVAQITAIFQEINSSISLPIELHLISHGAPGTLYLGNTELSLDTLSPYAAELRTWFTPPHPTCMPSPSTLHLYGCNVTAGDAGAEFLAILHHLTGANLAASTRKIGQGTWNLDTTFPAQTSNLKPQTSPPPLHPCPLRPHTGRWRP